MVPYSYKFSVNESVVYFKQDVFKRKHTENIDWLTKM